MENDGSPSWKNNVTAASGRTERGVVHANPGGQELISQPDSLTAIDEEAAGEGKEGRTKWSSLIASYVPLEARTVAILIAERGR